MKLIFFHIVNISGMVSACIASVYLKYSSLFHLKFTLASYSFIGPILIALYMSFIKKQPNIAVLYMSMLLFFSFLVSSGLHDVISSRGFFLDRPEIEDYKSSCFSSKYNTDSNLIIMFCEKVVTKTGETMDVFYDNTGEIAAPPASRSDNWNRTFELLASSAVKSEIYEINQFVTWSYAQMKVKPLGSGLIDHIQKMTVAAMQIADMKVCAHRS